MPRHSTCKSLERDKIVIELAEFSEKQLQLKVVFIVGSPRLHGRKLPQYAGTNPLCTRLHDDPAKCRLEMQKIRGCGKGTCPAVKVSDHVRHVISSSSVPLKTRRVGERCSLNLLRAQTPSRWCGVVVRRGVSAQVSSSLLDHGSKLRGSSPKALLSS
ncbi:uncharacterized protein TNCV_3753941 [Trichonephila clavipes]|nr:uncharacterized protein TNCV_3753941 [Trichonephila clavipes]